MKDGTVCGVMLEHDRRPDEGDSAWWNRFVEITRGLSTTFGEPDRIASTLASTCTSAPACVHGTQGEVAYSWRWFKQPEFGIVATLGREDGADAILTHYLQGRCYDDDVTKDDERSTVHFDEFGITFAIPTTFHVVGDEDLAQRVRQNTRDVYLRRELLKRIDRNAGFMLVAIATNDGQQELTVSVSAVTSTNKNEDAAAVAKHEVTVMSESFRHLEVTSAPTKLTTDGVDGAEWSSRYFIDGHPTRVASRMRVYIHGELTVIEGAVWPDGNPKLAESAPRALDGLHFLAR